MHEYPIEGVQNGTLRAEKDGLYWKIDASCTRDWDHPIRLLAETDGVRVNLGVPQPAAQLYTCAVSRAEIDTLVNALGDTLREIA